MRAVVQRVKNAAVHVDGEEFARIRHGLLVMVGFTQTDTEEVVQWMARKILSLRVFEDENGKMNVSLEAVGGEILVVSQFTLYGDCHKGKRPSFDKSAPHAAAEVLYDRFIEILMGQTVCEVSSGVFQAHMEVTSINDGPVTLIIDKEAV